MQTQTGAALENLWLACQPEIPAPGKWTKLGSILSFLVLGFNCCHCLEPIYKLSLEEFKAKKKNTETQTQKDQGEGEELDPAVCSDLHWSAVFGKRSKNGLILTSSGKVKFHALALAMMQEVTRYLTNWRLTAGSRQNRQSLKAPPLLDIANPKFSPHIMVLQYLTSLLRGEGRALLICPSSGSVLEWERNNKDEVRIWRRVIMYVQGWIYRRHLLFAEEPPISTLAP